MYVEIRALIMIPAHSERLYSTQIKNPRCEPGVFAVSTLIPYRLIQAASVRL
jgi:hypothetical protein